VYIKDKSKIDFYNLIYNKAILFLERKEEQFRAAMEKSIVKNIG
jgi:hypothetical protein